MSAVGPELPPHLQAKRKREDEEETHDTPPKRPRSSSTTSNEHLPKRIIGPTPPPAPLSELPPTPPSPDAEEASSSSSDDDDFGPSLPPIPGSTTHTTSLERQQTLEKEITARESAKKPQREEWMLVPPSQSDWTSRIDPTKLRNRKFNTSKNPKPTAPSSSESPLWTETPEQKRQRLEDEVLGVRKPAQLGPTVTEEGGRRKEEEARETERRIREFNEREGRGGSLLGEFKKGKEGREKEDDPSKRAFDREKDIGLGGKIGHKAKREMVERAKDFGSRFAGGRYL